MKGKAIRLAVIGSVLAGIVYWATRKAQAERPPGQPPPEPPPPEPPPPEPVGPIFEISDLVLDKYQIYAGDLVGITAKVTNVGDEDGFVTITLLVDSASQQQRLFVPAGMTLTAVFTLQFQLPKTYIIDVEGLKATLQVLAAPVGALQYEEAYLAKYVDSNQDLPGSTRPYPAITEANEGDSISCWIRVKNYGSAAGSATITVESGYEGAPRLVSRSYFSVPAAASVWRQVVRKAEVGGILIFNRILIFNIYDGQMVAASALIETLELLVKGTYQPLGGGWD